MLKGASVRLEKAYDRLPSPKKLADRYDGYVAGLANVANENSTWNQRLRGR